MDEPRSFVVAEYVHTGLLMVLLGLVAALSASEQDETDEGLTLMWQGCRTVFSGLLVAFPSIQRRRSSRDEAMQARAADSASGPAQRAARPPVLPGHMRVR